MDCSQKHDTKAQNSALAAQHISHEEEQTVYNTAAFRNNESGT